METNNHHPVLAAFSSIVSLISASFCLITTDVQPYFTLAGSCVAITSGVFAIRYYYFATKKIKK